MTDPTLSPLDGRYRGVTAPLAELLSESALNRARIEVEVEWLLFLTDRSLFGSSPVSAENARRLRSLVTEFGPAEVAQLAELEARTRHDVKAVEYFVRARLADFGLTDIAELTHFAATSEDINNLAYAIIIRRAIAEVWWPAYSQVLEALRERALAYRAIPMLSHTHGQPATPTTMGKELAVFVRRLERAAERVLSTEYLGKFNGATGTFAAHVAALPDADWTGMSRDFVTGLGLAWNPLTTQIESHDWQVDLYHALIHANGILHNFASDIWMYISMGYFVQQNVEGATGSSTMPHKINPIRFENAEANLELSTGVLGTIATTLVTSRLQRDLTDSTTQRNVGVGLGHSLVALDNLRRGLGEIHVDEQRMHEDLDANWEVLGEAIQTVIRAEVTAGRSSIADPYGVLKDLTRGRRLGAAELAEFITGLDIGDEAKTALLALTPATYTGLASELVSVIEPVDELPTGR